MKDPEIIRAAVEKVCKSKRKKHGKPTGRYKKARRILAQLDKYAARTLEIVLDTEAQSKAERDGETITPGTFPLAFEPAKVKTFVRRCECSGKVRTISCVPIYPDQIIHQLMVMTASPSLMRGMYQFSCGSIPKRGTHKGKKKIERYIGKCTKVDRSGIKYVAQLDIKKCYDNIAHKNLKDRLRKKFRGYLFLQFCELVISAYGKENESGEKIGLPIGLCTSPWFCNFTLTPIDFFLLQEKKVGCLVRYVDDMVFFGRNKKELHQTVRDVMEAVKSAGCTIKENWQVYRFAYRHKASGEIRGRALDVLGFRFFRRKTIMRKRNALGISRAARRIKKKKMVPVEQARSFMSKIGCLKHCDSKRFYEKNIKPFVNIKKLKEAISYESRKQYRACPV